MWRPNREAEFRMARSKAVSYTRDLAVANQLGCGTTVWNAYPYMAWWWSHGLPLVVGFPMTCLPYVQMAQHTRTTPHRWSTCPPQSTCAVPSAISSRLPPGPLPDRSSPSGAPSSLARRDLDFMHAICELHKDTSAQGHCTPGGSRLPRLAAGSGMLKARRLNVRVCPPL